MRVCRLAPTKESSRALNVPDDLAVDGTRDAVLELEVHLRNSVFWEYRGVGEIACNDVLARVFA